MSAAERDWCTAPPSLRQLDRSVVVVPHVWLVVSDWPSRAGQARRSRVVNAAVSRPAPAGQAAPSGWPPRAAAPRLEAGADGLLAVTAATTPRIRASSSKPPPTPKPS